VTTAAARNLAERRIRCDRIFYYPLDLSPCVRRALAIISPSLVLIAETEIWPNFLRAAAARQVPVLFINGRISARSFARYRLLRRWLRPPLGCARGFLMQTPTDAARAVEIGAPPERVQAVGNLKFDLRPAELPELRQAMQLALRQARITQVVVAASTMEGEEAPVLAAWQRLCQRPARRLLLLAPRHPQRFAAVRAQLDAAQLPWMNRSQLGQQPLPPDGVLLLDTLGELATLYVFAAVAFIGGSLVPHGGHNLLEPAYFAVPVVFGPYMHNFAAIAEEFIAAGAAFRTDSADELAVVWLRLLQDDALRQTVGQAGQALLRQQRGATPRVLAAIAAQLAPAQEPMCPG
jgi:3-deoxy-D-manno-octulosonic-acid transferase